MTDLEVRVLLATSEAGAREAGRTWTAWLPTLAADFVVNVCTGRTGGLVPMVGTPDVMGARWAVDSHRHDLDDVHYESLTHPGSVVWPALLPIAAAAGAPMADLAGAAALGYEVTARLGRALLPLRSALHTTCIAGAGGAAAAAASVLGLDERQTADAVAHAVSASGGLGQCLVEASGTRAFHRASAAQTGLLAAVLAADGLAATREVFEGASGLWALLPRADPGSLGAPGPPAAPLTRVRVERTCGFYQAAVRAVRAVAAGEEVVLLRVPEQVAAFSAGRPAGADLAACVRGLASVSDDVRVEGDAGLPLHAAEAVTRDGRMVPGRLPAAAEEACRRLVEDKARVAGADQEVAWWAAAVETPDRPVGEVLQASAISRPEIGAP